MTAAAAAVFSLGARAFSRLDCLYTRALSVGVLIGLDIGWEKYNKLLESEVLWGCRGKLHLCKFSMMVWDDGF